MDELLDVIGHPFFGYWAAGAMAILGVRLMHKVNAVQHGERDVVTRTVDLILWPLYWPVLMWLGLYWLGARLRNARR